MERLKRLIPVFIICAIPLIITGCKGGFDASGYTGAILDLQFQGDAGSARAMVAGATSENLQDMYQEFIDNFVAGYITDGMDISEEEIGEFRELAAIIFSSMRYGHMRWARQRKPEERNMKFLLSSSLRIHFSGIKIFWRRTP